MKLGLELGYSGAKMALPMDLIVRAEELSFDSVWTAESYGSDVFSPLAYIAALTKRIRLCTGIAQLAARTPANCAMTAQTIEELAGRGRMVVGRMEGSRSEETGFRNSKRPSSSSSGLHWPS